MQITVGTSGTGGGFEKFCNGETDISDASRPIKADDETEGPNCEKNGIEYAELQVANDGSDGRRQPGERLGRLPHRRAAQDDLGAGAEGTVTNWNQVDPSFPDEKLELFGAGHRLRARSTTSPTRSTVRRARAAPTTTRPRTTTSRCRASPAPRAASATSASPTTRRTPTSSRHVEIDGGDGCVAPSTETVQDGDVHAAQPPAVHLPVAGVLADPKARRSSSTTSTTRTSIAETALFVPLDRRAAAGGDRRGDGAQGRNDADDLAARRFT